MANVLVFGDSIAYGFNDSLGGWVDRLKRYYFENESFSDDKQTKVYNLGISGDTTSDLLSRIEEEIKPRSWENEKTILVIATGINDTVITKEGVRTPEKSFQKNITRLIKISKGYSSNIVFVGLTPIIESFVVPLPWNKDESIYNSIISTYDNVIKTLAFNNQCNFVDLNKLFTDRKLDELLDDGLHPNETGHELIKEEVKYALNIFLRKN